MAVRNVPRLLLHGLIYLIKAPLPTVHTVRQSEQLSAVFFVWQLCWPIPWQLPAFSEMPYASLRAHLFDGRFS